MGNAIKMKGNYTYIEIAIAYKYISHKFCWTKRNYL